jgi:sugar lactone lactonase YvrE
MLRCRSGGSGQRCPVQHQQEVRAVQPAAAGGQLSHSRVLVLASLFTGLDNGYINDAVITPDGSAVTILSEHSAPRSNVTSVLQASAATGKVVRVLYRVNTGNGVIFQYFNVDPSGRYVILNTGPINRSRNGWIHHGHLIPLKPRGRSAWYAAW